eukprot:scaffold6829_cov49-Cylindrotheca_fusiformis.AAC.3
MGRAGRYSQITTPATEFNGKYYFLQDLSYTESGVGVFWASVVHPFTSKYLDLLCSIGLAKPNSIQSHLPAEPFFLRFVRKIQQHT